MSILNVNVKKEGKTTSMEMDIFPLIYTIRPTKIISFSGIILKIIFLKMHKCTEISILYIKVKKEVLTTLIKNGY